MNLQIRAQSVSIHDASRGGAHCNVKFCDRGVMFQKVLVLSASVGAGHIRAAQAIEKSFVQLNAARQVRNVDTLQYTNKVFQDLYSKAYIELVNKAPDVLGWLYDHFDKPWQNERLRLAFEKLNTRPFVKMLEQYQPEITVCTHFLPAEIISWLKAKSRLSTRQVITITDFDVHAMWLCREYEHYFVALEETRCHLEELGVPSEKITVSGIPIDPVFADHKDKLGMRLKHGLEPSRTTILVSAGGFGVGPIEKLMQSLVKMSSIAQIIAVCGRNEELKSRIDNLVGGLPPDCPVRIIPIGYTTEMDEYMSAADLVLGKPGGLTAFEALVGVVNEGTGKKAKLEKWQVFGKTGTANIAKANGRGYSEDDYMASFIGGVPVAEPRR
ncbi:MAG TPA: penicillin-binding transpeptidase domain-containing protein [Sedimentisphaerales bacterium]|nr:penicillin-binding transpeptidase domain-containing protein [Sedimentisphaerales bacterium]